MRRLSPTFTEPLVRTPETTVPTKGTLKMSEICSSKGREGSNLVKPL